jgi:hypothetical protein
MVVGCVSREREECGVAVVAEERGGGAARHGQNVGGRGCSEAVMMSGYRTP